MTETFTKAEAETLKLIAEAEAAREEAATARLNQQLRAAEIRKETALATTAEHDSVIRAITRTERERVEQLALIQDHYVNEHFFEGPVAVKSVYSCLNTLAAWHRVNPKCDMNITINSPGGSVIDGMHLFDQLVAYSKRGGGEHHVTITVRGFAASMGGILLQAADTRVIGRESYLMIHEISSGVGGKIGEIKDEVKWYEKVCERITDIFYERSEGKITREKFKDNWERKEWWLDSKESLELGFVDRIG